MHPPAKVGAPSLGVAVSLALAIAVVNGFARFAYALILPAMREDLAWDYVASGWLNAANSLGYALGGLSGMFLLTRFRASRLFMFGLVATVLCVMAVGLTRNLYGMLAWRLLAGIGAAWVFSCGGRWWRRITVQTPPRPDQPLPSSLRAAASGLRSAGWWCFRCCPAA